MTMVMEQATYIAENGTKFTFRYSERNREIGVYIDDTLRNTIVNVKPEDSAKEMNAFMDMWNNANPSPELTVYRATLVHDTFKYVKIVVEFSSGRRLSQEEQWGEALCILQLSEREFRLDSTTPIKTPVTKD